MNTDKRVKVLDKDVEIMVDARKCGCTLKEVGDMFNLTKERVRQICKNNNVSGRITSEVISNNLKLLVENGKSTNEIVEILGIQRTSLYERCRKMGIPTPGSIKRNAVTQKHDRIVALFRHGKSRVELAKEFGIGYEQILRILKKYGIRSKPQKGEKHGS